MLSFEMKITLCADTSAFCFSRRQRRQPTVEAPDRIDADQLCRLSDIIYFCVDARIAAHLEYSARVACRCLLDLCRSRGTYNAEIFSSRRNYRSNGPK